MRRPGLEQIRLRIQRIKRMRRIEPSRRFFNGWGRDFKLGVRTIRRAPGMTAVACMTLALGVGANAAVFSLVYKVLLEAPPGVIDAGAVKRVDQRFVAPGAARVFTRDVFSYPELAAIQRAAAGESFAAAGYSATQASGGALGEERPIAVEYVVGDYFRLLGTAAAAGRLFSGNEAQRTSPGLVAVISDRLWNDEFGRRSDIIGQQLLIDNRRFTIAGVVRSPFHGLGLGEADVWAPFNTVAQESAGSRPFDNVRDARLHVVVRLHDSRSEPEIAAAIGRALRQDGAIRLSSATALLAPIGAALDPERGRLSMAILTRLMGAAVLILIVASANVANMMIVQALDRRRELAVRLALGAGRRELARHLTAEVLIVLLVAGVGAAWVAALLRTALQDLLLPGIPSVASTIDPKLVAEVGIVLAGVAVMMILIPLAAIDVENIDRQLRSGVAATPKGNRARHALLAIQAAISVTLCVGAAVFGKSLHKVAAISIGYSAPDVMVASVPIDVSQPGRANAIATLLHGELERITRSPLVESAALSATRPIEEATGYQVYVPGADSMPTPLEKQVFVSAVSPGFLTTMGVRLIRGRDFRNSDVPGAQLVTLVSGTMARDYWPQADPIGKCIVVGRRSDPCRVIVGVVDDVHSMHILEDPSLRFYLPMAQADGRFAIPNTIVARARPGLASQMRQALQTQLLRDGQQTVSLSPRDWRVATFADIIAPELQPWRTSAELFAALAFLAVAVAGVRRVWHGVVLDRSTHPRNRDQARARRDWLERLPIGRLGRPGVRGDWRCRWSAAVACLGESGESPRVRRIAV